MPASIFLWFSHGFPYFNIGPVAVSAPPVATARGCPLPFSYGFPVVFPHFQPWAGGWSTSTGCHRQRVPASIFLWFSCGFPHFQPWAGGNNTSAGPPPAAGARFHFPMVFLWFSHFQPWAGGNNTSAGPPPAAGARFHFPMVFLWFSYTFSPVPVAGTLPLAGTSF